MIKLQHIRATVKNRFGELWWYTTILFVTQQLGSIINAFIGLWLVPQYVPTEELGAVLPLMKVGGFIMLPIGILIMPYKKFLNKFATNNEWGKVKQLILDMFAISIVLTLAAFLYAHFFMPFIFERLRVADGMLGLLIIFSGIITAISPIFVTILEALKQFKLISIAGLVCAPTRLLVLMIAMPIRGLSGYFTGQIVSDVLAIVFSLKKIGLLISNSVKRRPYIKSDGMDILKYLLPVAIMSVFGTLITVTEAFVIRHRLPDIESAAYYMISRFAEIGNYFGNAIVFVLFPLVSEQHERGSSSLRILTQAVGAIAVAGGLLSIVIYVLGDTLFMLTIAWHPYRPYVSHMAVLSMIVCIKSMAYCYMTHEMACNRFGCIYFGCGIYLVESMILYGLTGFNFFKPYVAVSIMNAIADFNPARLDFVLQIMLIFSLLILISYMVNHLLEWKSVKERSALCCRPRP